MARFSCTAPPKIERYIQWLLRQGMYGDSRAAVVRRMMCDGIIAALPGDTMRLLSEQFDVEKDAKP